MLVRRTWKSDGTENVMGLETAAANVAHNTGMDRRAAKSALERGEVLETRLAWFCAAWVSMEYEAVAV